MPFPKFGNIHHNRPFQKQPEQVVRRQSIEHWVHKQWCPSHLHREEVRYNPLHSRRKRCLSPLYGGREQRQHRGA